MQSLHEGVLTTTPNAALAKAFLACTGMQLDLDQLASRFSCARHHALHVPCTAARGWGSLMLKLACPQQ